MDSAELATALKRTRNSGANFATFPHQLQVVRFQLDNGSPGPTIPADVCLKTLKNGTWTNLVLKPQEEFAEYVVAILDVSASGSKKTTGSI